MRKKIFIVLLFSLFILLFFSGKNEVKASTDISFEYDGINYNVPVDFELKNYCVLTNIPPQNGYFILLTTSNDAINLAIEGAWTLYFYNTTEYGGSCNDISSYYYDSSSNTFIYGETGNTVWSGFLKGNLPLSCLTSNCDVYIIENANTTTSTANSAGYLAKKASYSITLSNTETTFEKIYFYSNALDSNYKVYISKDNNTWSEMDYSDNPLYVGYLEYYYYIYENGIYYFKFEDTTTNEIVYTTSYEVTNLGYDIYFSTEKTEDPLYCYSNTFAYDTMWVYISKDGTNWTSMNKEFIEYTPRKYSKFNRTFLELYNRKSEHIILNLYNVQLTVVLEILFT